MFSFIALIHDNGLVLWQYALDTCTEWRNVVNAFISTFIIRISTKDPIIGDLRIFDTSCIDHPRVRLIAGLPKALPSDGVADLLSGLLSAAVAQAPSGALNNPWLGDRPLQIDLDAHYARLTGAATRPTGSDDGLEAAADTTVAAGAEAETPAQEDADAAMARIAARMAARAGTRPRGGRKPKGSTTKKGAGAKTGRQWADKPAAVNEAECVVRGDEAESAAPPAVTLRDTAAVTTYRESSLKRRSVLSQLFSSRPSGRPLTEEDLREPFAALRGHLVSKNTPDAVVSGLFRVMAGELVGAIPKRGSGPGSFDGLVSAALSAAVRQTLTPTEEIDLVRAVRERRAARRAAAAARASGSEAPIPPPYKLVFVGVNGVGKSTTLSKVAHMLKSSGARVLIAACDTFRSGAVEQLHVHGKRLGVPVFDESYRSDAAMVCQHAVRKATQEDYDVVLVDTAGRMHNNAPHMQALARLVSVNSPDCILMVAEALVGNDSSAQLANFNAALADYATTPSIHLIDGQVLTKFDAVGDKVGTALSLVAETGKPIVYVGVGQTYVDIEPLSVDLVTSLLLAKSEE